MEEPVHQPLPPMADVELSNGGPHNRDVDLRGPEDIENADYSGNPGDGTASDKQGGAARAEKNKPNPNKVYIGGLPEHTREEDLQNCFGKIGSIVKIELKLGYGFVEFDTHTAAEESVAKYNEGFFMGNKIKVEISKGGSQRTKYTSSDPGACFKCGQMGHWARECPNHTTGASGRRPTDPPLIDRIQPPGRDYPPPRDYPSYRDDYRYPPPPRDSRYGYDYPPPRGEYRRPLTPPRDYRDYPPRSSREYDDHRIRTGPPPPLPPPRAPYYPPESGAPPASYPPRDYPPPAVRDPYDRYDKRSVPPERYPLTGRPRTPPGGMPPRDYDRAPSRDYPPEYRGRPASPPPARYGEYPPRAGSDVSGARYRRRSQSPPRSVPAPYDAGGYAPSSGAPYGGPPSSYAGNGYAGGAPPPSGSVRAPTAREYPPPPPPRNGR